MTDIDTDFDIKENIKNSIDKVNYLISFYYTSPYEEMTELEYEVTKLCNYINSVPNKSNIPFKDDLQLLMIKVENLAEKIKNNQEVISHEIKKLNLYNKGYQAYNKVTCNNDDSSI